MRLRGFIILGAIISVLVGFWLGKAVVADSPAPGSADDPLVTKSYADKAIQERVTDLEKTVAELSVQAQTLQNTLNELQNRVITTPTVKPEPTPVPKEEPKKEEPAPTPQLPADSMIGKTLCISTQNYANLRSAPTLEADVLKEVTADLEMVVQKVEGEWYNVKLSDGTIGWINQRVVKVKE